MRAILSLVIITLVACAVSVTHGNVSTEVAGSEKLITQARPSPSPTPKLKRLKRARVRRNGDTATVAAPAEFCWFPWNSPWHHGDCQLASRDLPTGLKGPEFCFRSNGTGTFKSRARSTDDDDKYVVRFEFSDRNGKLLFRLPAETGPFGGPTFWTKDIDNPGIWYDWNIDFGFPAQHFQQIYYVNAWAGC